MLRTNQAMATVAVKDLEVAREFYQSKLGLETVGPQQEQAATYKTGASTLLVYESQYAGTNEATAVTWLVGNEFDAIVTDLRAKGVRFERYDMPDVERQGDVHISGDMKMVWFKDPDGNIHGVMNH